MHSDDAWGTVWNKIFSKELKKDLIFPGGKELEDYYVLLRLYTKIDQVYFDSKPMYLWYQREGTQSKRGYHKNIRTMLDVTSDIKDLLKDCSIYEKELAFFEFVNRYAVVIATYKTKDRTLYNSIRDDIREINKLKKTLKRVHSDNRNIRKMLLKIKYVEIMLCLSNIGGKK